MSEVKDYQTAKYWNERTKKYKKDPQALLFRDPRFKEYEARTRQVLDLWKGLRVADIACGYGRFANIFALNNYIGYDFSQEMIKLAKDKNPKYYFEACDVKSDHEIVGVDVVFEVNSLHCLGMTPIEFFEKYKDKAKIAVACLEADQFTIFQTYP